MQFTPIDPPVGGHHNPIARAREHVFLIIDADETRSQRLACLLTLAGLRAIVASNTYQAFERFLQEHFMPRAILIGQQEETSSTLFMRLSQRLTQEFRREIPLIPLSNVKLSDGNLLMADELASTTVHRLSKANSDFLKTIWQVVPSAQFSLKPTEHPVVLETLPKIGLPARVSKKKRSLSLHFHYQLKAAKQLIPAALWETLLTDVGLAQYRKEENWPSTDEQYTILPEQTTCLTRAIMFSNPQQPFQHVYNWINKIDSEILHKFAVLFIMQQIPKIMGRDFTMRALLNGFSNEMNHVRGEKMADWKRLENGSFIFVLYSNMFVYGLMGANQVICYGWMAAFDQMLDMAKQQKHWQIREIECSAQSHTGHCVFLFSPKSS